jgi:hypothetical protein
MNCPRRLDIVVIIISLLASQAADPTLETLQLGLASSVMARDATVGCLITRHSLGPAGGRSGQRLVGVADAALADMGAMILIPGRATVHVGLHLVHDGAVLTTLAVMLILLTRVGGFALALEIIVFIRLEILLVLLF